MLKRIEKDVLLENPDLVILMVGTNDMVNSKKMVSDLQFKKNYQCLIDQLKAQKIMVVAMSPPPVDTGYLFIRHDRKLYSEDPNLKLITAGNIVKQLAADNEFHFIDLNSAFKAKDSPNRGFNSLIINELNFNMKDGIHPTKEGYKFIAEIVSAYLKKKKLLKNSKKIICFGDSITFGSFMTGAGTAEGDTYPALLKKIIN